jgi:hypothetical protein
MDMTYCQLTSHLNPFNQSVMDLSQVQLTSNEYVSWSIDVKSMSINVMFYECQGQLMSWSIDVKVYECQGL